MAQQKTFAKEDYTIGWVCALPLELVAARHMLDEIHVGVQEQDISDHNSYVLGNIGQHNIVVACLPAGVYGITPAATVAKDMLRTFSSIRFGLLVGIGGGAPSATHDIRLGDVVVSRPSNKNGGVIQYDRGKRTYGGKFKCTSILNSPPNILLTAMSNLEAKHAGSDSKIMDFLEDVVRRYPKLKKEYTYPGEDHLYQADYEHPTERPTCDTCDSRCVITRGIRQDNNPCIHYGSIASSSQVMKDAVMRDQLSEELEVLCFEMEAAGLMQDFPCLVIRGVCDYADSHKNKRWQSYAAAVAACYAKELLGLIPMARIQKEEAIKVLNTFTKHTEEVHRHHHQQEIHDREQQLHNQRQEAHNNLQRSQRQVDKNRDCHRAFKTSNYEDHKNINPDRIDGTCHWVLDNPKFQEWRSRLRGDLLWISADPGCGKSVLSKSLVDHDLSIDTSLSGLSLCYFFFKDNEVQDQLATALCAVLHQWFTQQPLLIRHAIPAWERLGNKLQQEVDELWRILENAAADADNKLLICILDALDECCESDQRRLVTKLCRFYERSVLSDSNQGMIKFLVTSRPCNMIQDAFQAIPESLPSIRLYGEDENDLIHQEIDMVIRHRVSKMAFDLKLCTNTTQRVEQTLLNMQHRTYLWLYLTIEGIYESFRDALEPEQVSIDILPASVEIAYEQILQRCNAKQRQEVRLLLSIIVSARRALTVTEMAMAFKLASTSVLLRPKHLSDFTISSDRLRRNIRQWCGLFTFINHDRVYLIHQTAKEFLLRTGHMRTTETSSWKHCLSVAETERIMANICIGFLLIEDLSEYVDVRRSLSSHRPQSDEAESSETGRFFKLRKQSRDSERALFVYCAQNWAGHLRASGVEMDDPLVADACILHRTDNKQFQSWFPIVWKAMYSRQHQPEMTSVRLAAFHGLDTVLQQLLKNKQHDLEAKDNSTRTALAWASELGHKKVVEVLIENGAEVDNLAGSHGNALQAAALNGHKEVVQRLIDGCADVNANGGEYGTALQAASSEGHTQIVRALLDAGAHVNTQSGVYGSALQAASDGGHEGTVHLLIAEGADINSQGGYYGNALQAASAGGNHRVVELLIQHGAEVNARGGEYGNALQAASVMGHELIVQLLLKQGVDTNAQSDDHYTALFAAIRRGHDHIARTMLELGADRGKLSSKDWAALKWFASFGRVDTIARFIDCGMSIDIQTAEGLTLLHVAASEDQLATVQWLVNKGAKLDISDTLGRQPLHLALHNYRTDAVQYLLEKGANPHLRDCYGRSAVDWIQLCPELYNIKLETSVLRPDHIPTGHDIERYGNIEFQPTAARSLQDQVYRIQFELTNLGALLHETQKMIDLAHTVRARKSYEHILSDIRELRRRYEASVRYYEPVRGASLVNAQMKEKQASLESALSITRLTKLAFVFIPLSFTTSFFGMNLREWRQGSILLRTFFVTAVILGLCCLIPIMPVIAKSMIRSNSWWIMKVASQLARVHTKSACTFLLITMLCGRDVAQGLYFQETVFQADDHFDLRGEDPETQLRGLRFPMGLTKYILHKASVVNEHAKHLPSRGSRVA